MNPSLTPICSKASYFIRFPRLLERLWFNGARIGLPALLIALTALSHAPTARADAVPDSNVVAHASDDMLWVAQILAAPEIKPSGEKTTIRFRALNTADLAWHELPVLPGRVVQIANRGQTAAVLFKTGEWMLVWPDGTSTGPSLPRRSKMLALASERDRNTLYAIGIPSPASTAEPSDATSPPTTEPAASSQPQVSIDKPILYAFEGANWHALANCPQTQSQNAGAVSLAVVSRLPTIAQQTGEGSIQVMQLDEDDKWLDRGAIKTADAALSFRILTGTLRPMLWVGEKASAGRLYLGGEKWQDPMTLTLSRQMPTVNSSLVSAAGVLRMFVADEKNKLYEQRFDNAGNRIGDVTPLASPQPIYPPGYENWPMFAILGALALMMLTSARRRTAEDLADHDPDEIVLATSGQRLMAGLVDGMPIVVSLLYLAGNAKAMQDPADMTWLIPLMLAAGIYLVHTTVSELISGRTLGKIVVGLQVVAADGKPASAGAILVRNLLRLIDVFPVPLAFLIITSPMKQRLGDVLAGTIVVVGPRVVETDEKERDSDT